MNLRHSFETAEIVASNTFLPRPEVWPDLSELYELPGREEANLGESFSRVSEAMDSFRERFTGETVVAVTHAGFIMASIRVIFDIPTPRPGARLDPNLVSLTEWSFADGV